MIIAEILPYFIIKSVTGDVSKEFTGVSVDSRKVKKGDLFIALQGFQVDGHSYIKQAIENGAIGVVVEKDVDVAINVTKLKVKSTRYALAVIADLFYNRPSHKLKVIGVTGTNAKTTTTYLIENILKEAGHKTGLIGTIRVKIGDEEFPTTNTTPDIIELQRYFSLMREKNIDYCIMEVSSHALSLGRVNGINYHSAIFTNLTQDHLDYHLTMENYRSAKTLLFSQLGNSYELEPTENKYAIINIDDPNADYFINSTAKQVITYGFSEKADLQAKNMVVTANGTTFDCVGWNFSDTIKLKMIGKFSVYNSLAAMAAMLAEGIEYQIIKNSLEKVTGVEGRFQRINEGEDFTVIVDYAHTPDGLENVLSTIKQFVKGRIITVFGAGGDRDKTKRPIMGKTVVKYSDFVIVTSDNPRTEDPLAIINDILSGIYETDFNEKNLITLVDRKEAINFAIKNAKKGDVILIAGKGHETYQIIGKEVKHFDDREVAREALRRLV